MSNLTVIALVQPNQTAALFARDARPRNEKGEACKDGTTRRNVAFPPPQVRSQAFPIAAKTLYGAVALPSARQSIIN